VDLKKLSLREAMQLVSQFEQAGSDQIATKKLSVTDSRCPNCGCAVSKVPMFAIIIILAGVAVAVLST
jgi:hypothetical protein